MGGGDTVGTDGVLESLVRCRVPCSGNPPRDVNALSSGSITLTLLRHLLRLFECVVVLVCQKRPTCVRSVPRGNAVKFILYKILQSREIYGTWRSSPYSCA